MVGSHQRALATSFLCGGRRQPHYRVRWLLRDLRHLAGMVARNLVVLTLSGFRHSSTGEAATAVGKVGTVRAG